METGKITIIRARYFNDKMSGKGFNVFIDGEDMGKVSYIAPMTLELPVGEHIVYAKINSFGSKEMTVNIASDETKEIELGLTNPPTKQRLIILTIINIIYFGGIFLGNHYKIDWLFAVCSIPLISYFIYHLFFLKKNSELYSIFFGRKNYLYLKELTNANS